jgi:predicted glycosyltransferase
MRQVLFYVTNGMSLGHLQRVANIAEQTRNRTKRIKIILATSSLSPSIFGKFYDHLVALIPLSDAMLKIPNEKTRRRNSKKLAAAFLKYKPDLVVADFYLPSNFTFYPLKFALQSHRVKTFFIWRLGEKKNCLKDLRSEKDKIDYFDKAWLPYAAHEIKEIGGPALLHSIKGDKKFKICGPIFRSIKKDAINYVRRKYGIESEACLITASFGGGGEIKAAQCHSPRGIYRQILRAYPKLVKSIPRLKIVICLGPYYNHMLVSNDKIITVKFEKNLVELFSLSKLVIATAGYNICQDIIAAQVPALLTPVLRKDREQFDRAYYLEKKGIAMIWREDSNENFGEAIVKCYKKAESMKSKFKEIAKRRNGAEFIAGEIIKSLY